jgi:hypothetical protein
MFLDLELCLSWRPDLVMAVLERIFEGRLTGFHNQQPDVVAHAVRVAPLVKLHFLVSSDGLDKNLRRRLIVAGELMLDELYSRSPWRRPALISESEHKPPARLEIYAKCQSIEESAWFERCDIPAAEIALVRSTTAVLRNLPLDSHRLKTLLPLLVASSHTNDVPSNDERSRTGLKVLSVEERRWLDAQLSRLRTSGLLWTSCQHVTSDDRHFLQVLQSHIATIADALGVYPSVVIRSVLRQLGFTDIEREYIMKIGFALRDQPLEQHSV